MEVNRHVKEQIDGHMMDMAKKLVNIFPEPGGTEAVEHRCAPARSTRGGMESVPQEQASQEVCLNELSTRTQEQRKEIDELKRVITALTNTVHRLEHQVQETRMRQERPVQELNVRCVSQDLPRD